MAAPTPGRHAGRVEDGEFRDRSAPDYVGLTEEQARTRAATAGRPFRVMRRDDDAFLLTMDYVDRRVNVVVEAGVVVAAERG